MDMLIKLKIGEEETNLKEPYDKYYEAICSTAYYRLSQADNLTFEVDKAEIIYELEDFEKLLDKLKLKERIVDIIGNLSVAGLLELGGREDGE